MTALLSLRDAYLRSFTARLIEAREDAVVLDRTAFYATDGGRPNDMGRPAGRLADDVRKVRRRVRHVLYGVVLDG